MRLLSLFPFMVLLVGCVASSEQPYSTELSTSVPTAILTDTSSRTPMPSTSTPTLLKISASNTPRSIETHTPQVTPIPTDEPVIRFAVIGDFGGGGQPEADVANLVKSWQPDFIITTGDNNYPDGSDETIDTNIGQFYHEFIFPYIGVYGEGASQNRFFPTLGNHDWNTASAQPYFDYFTLPGNERYYDFIWGPLHFFALDSDSREPDGVGRSSDQADWLQEGLTNSTATWKIVYMHQPPYSSGINGSVDWTRWPYKEWGVTAVLAGHDHTYERFVVDGFPYFVNGLGGGVIYPFSETLAGSQVRYNADHGAMLVEATQDYLTFQFITRQSEVIDTYTIEGEN